MITRSLKGFTLIELLVVIAIIAMLASIILASLNQARSKSRDARRVADLRQLQTAVEEYINNNGGTPPASLAALVTAYIQSVPADPANSSTAYGFSVSGNHYCIGATLENAVPAGAAGSCSVATGGGNTNVVSGNYFVGS